MYRGDSRAWQRVFNGARRCFSTQFSKARFFFAGKHSICSLGIGIGSGGKHRGPGPLRTGTEPFQLFLEVSGRSLRDRAAKKPKGGAHAPCCNPRLVHKLRIDVPLHAGKMLPKPQKLMREDLPNGEIKAVVQSNPEFLRRLLGRDRNLEPLDGNFKL